MGQWTDARAMTGCTVVLMDGGGTGGASVRGGAPGTRDIELLQPTKSVERIEGILLSGGSTFGLAAADGVMRWLEERGAGIRVGPALIPLVPAAVVFDLAVGDGRVRPGPDQGYAAAAAATADPPEEGRVGAGTGATVGKMFGREHVRPGGIGTASVRIGTVTVGALFVVNAVGDVVGEDGALVGAREGTPRIAERLLAGERPLLRTAREGTTIGVVATDAPLTKVECNVVADSAHDGLARAVHPAHTRLDGDTTFAVSTGRGTRIDLETICLAAVEVTAAAIRRAVREHRP